MNDGSIGLSFEEEFLNESGFIDTISDGEWDENEENMCDEMMETIAYGLLELSKSTSFREVVNDEVDVMFDDDDNVLLKTLNAHSEIQNLITEMGSTLSEVNKSSLIGNLSSAVNGFGYYDDTLYIQIYIPYKDLVDRNENPVICINYSDEYDTLQGMFLNGSGTIDYISVDSNYAKENLVWVISVNETIDNKGLIPEQPYTLNKTMSTGKAAEINRIWVTESKEKWAGGKSEISHLTIHVSHNYLNVLTCSSAKYLQGTPFAKLPKKKLNGWTGVFVGSLNVLASSYTYVWDFENQHISFLLYEYDKRKTRKIQFYQDCSGTVKEYTSKHDSYGVVRLQKSHLTTDPSTFEYNNTNTTGLSGIRVEVKAFNQ
ncbi:MAG: hypothetical protein M3Q97_10380 [Bacteroidota bacterium]|nr:hypothetical protein [Bacteroidota bacterium]